MPGIPDTLCMNTWVGTLTPVLDSNHIGRVAVGMASLPQCRVVNGLLRLGLWLVDQTSRLHLGILRDRPDSGGHILTA